jgi:hypothetical protein
MLLFSTFLTIKGLNIVVNAEGLLESARSLPNDQLEEFAVEVLRLAASRRSPSLSKSETETMKEIHRPLSPDSVARYQELVGKRDSSTLSADEHRELCALSDWLEQRNAQRLGHVADLARARGVTLGEMMQRLGLEHLAASS